MLPRAEVRPDADLHVLRPRAAPFESALSASPLPTPASICERSAPISLWIVARTSSALLASPPGLLLDHALQQAHGEGDAACLDRLHVARREQLRRQGRAAQRAFDQRLHATQRLARRMARDVEDVGAIEQVGGGGRARRDIEHFAPPHDDDRWSVEQAPNATRGRPEAHRRGRGAGRRKGKSKPWGDVSVMFGVRVIVPRIGRSMEPRRAALSSDTQRLRASPQPTMHRGPSSRRDPARRRIVKSPYSKLYEILPRLWTRREPGAYGGRAGTSDPG